MDARTAFWFWYDFSRIAGSAVQRQQGVDSDDPHIDWERQQQAMLTAGLSFACSMFETLGYKSNQPHNTVLAHLRNALLHNDGNIAKNFGAPKPEQECATYLASESWKAFDPVGSTVRRQFFDIDSHGQVTLNRTIFFFIERLFDSYLSQADREKPPTSKS